MGPFDEQEHNQAAWLIEPNSSSLEILGAEFPVNVQQNHVIIRVKALAINPIDAKIQATNILDWQPSSYPNLLGCDIAGEIYDVHENIASDRFEEGDRVLACTAPVIDSREPKEGGFQKFVSVRVDLVSKIPESMAFAEAATLPLAVATASQALYGMEYLYLPWPALHPTSVPETEQKWVLIWGGSSSVGTAAVQLASASGLNVVATASEQHHDLVGALGATTVFDYQDPEIEDQILSILTRRNFAGVFDAVGTEDSKAHIKILLDALGGGVWASVAEVPWASLPKNVRGKQVLAQRILEEDPEVARRVFGEFSPSALKQGLLRPGLEVEVVGRGLEKVQEGIMVVAKGAGVRNVVVVM
ncbi:oxidoreductase [Teratosphaeria nubilosa]|uniref:Oxidoreductase n=1 Tax=Teratosphaeria nubilosa TaxID=161662 RepID=A0A6G1LGZ6_9PEZI|nr:oxidoreductase [Teratosphaeria nubilosa]